MPFSDTAHTVSPFETLDILRSRLNLFGFDFVADLAASRGRYLRNALSGEDYLDFYAFFASQPLGYNHPRLREPEFQAALLTAATTKVANTQVYTQAYAEFVRTFDRIAGLPGYEHLFLIDGGALAVENALKIAFDWKVRKNLAAGRGEIGHKIIHFREAFHGRSGYTLSLTNTADLRKTMYFPMFDWPRIDNPRLDFAQPEPERTADVVAREAQAVAQIEAAVAQHGPDIAALIIEPIQAEGGDNHFRPEFFRTLRTLCDRHELLLIYDEIQTGLGMTGKMWCCQHFDALPDLLVFGKKAQICGVIANGRIDDVDNVFKVPTRIASTWGGNLADMVRATRVLEIIRDEELVARAAENGAYLLAGLHKLVQRHECVSAPRGRGLLCAFDLPSGEIRDAVRKACFERKLLILGCGVRSIRFRPVLDVECEDIDRALAILDDILAGV
ncbi:MAG: L-lysine 6-transaminase [Planctomycetes bacterium]|nr:L-lysine 6-transaminase [Planctomycetota bacterium]